MAISRTDVEALAVRPAESIRASDAVRHVDQLDELALARFYEAVESGGPVAPVDERSFEHGEVIVANGYYRIAYA